MSTTAEADAAPSGLRKVVAASTAGTVVEWYEFFLYATAATLVFNKVFFPAVQAGGNDLDNIIKAFLTYAVGFVARPIGGIVFGHFGDRYGRKHLLQIAIVLVGVATFLMGCLPTFAQVGYAAPMLLVGLRFLQGFAVGGEWGGAVLLVAEHSPDSQRGFWASWPQAAVPLGNLLATLVLLTLSWTLSDSAFMAWGWRVGFWLSVIIVAIGYYIRTRISDAPIFHEARKEIERNKASSYGVIEVFRRYPRGVFTAMGLRVAENILYYMVVTFSITYLKTQLHMDTRRILLLLLIAHVVQAIALPIVGRYTDIAGRRAPYALGGAAVRGLGLYRLPDVQYPERVGDLDGHRDRAAGALTDVRGTAGDHGRDVPHPDALFRSVGGLSSDLDLRRVAGSGHRHRPARQVPQLGAGRGLSGGRRPHHTVRGVVAAGNQRQLAT